MQQDITAHLLSLDTAAFNAATQHPWLRLIGQGKLPADAQLTWLKQDRLYALSYVTFIGKLLAKVSIPTTADRTSTLEWRIADVLIEALVGIKRELAMFEDILRDNFAWGKSSEEHIEPAPPTKLYQQLFADASDPECPLIVGLMALWATEKCYLEAWKFAKSQQQGSSPTSKKNVVQEILIPNWTSSEFEAFVDTLGGLTNEFVSQSKVDQRQTHELEGLWQRILEVEKQFWPDV